MSQLRITTRLMAAENVCAAVERHEKAMDQLDKNHWDGESIDEYSRSYESVYSTLAEWKKARQADVEGNFVYDSSWVGVNDVRTEYNAG